MVDLCLLDPERWILSRLSFYPCDSIVSRINPDLAPVEKLVFHFWFDSKYVKRPTALECLRLKHKVIVRRGQRRLLLVRIILLSLEKFLQHVVDKHVGPGFIDDLKTFSGCSIVSCLYVHICCHRSTQAVEIHVVVPSRRK